MHKREFLFYPQKSTHAKAVPRHATILSVDARGINIHSDVKVRK
jgi:hypothetical protein